MVVTRTRWARLAAGLAALLVLAACSGGSDGAAPTASSSATVVPPPTTDDPPAFGAWTQPQNGYSRQRQMAAVTDLERELGHKLAIDHFFVAQMAPATTFAWRLKWDEQQNRTPMITFGFGMDTHRIAAGDYDRQLRGYAQAIRAGGNQTVLLRYAHEMDGAKNVGWVHDGPSYVAAWKHVHAQFEGLDVQWVWSPNAPAFGGRNGGVDAYWPGDDQVDWVAADGYNFYDCQNRSDWKTFRQIFTPFLRWAAAKDKPQMVAEFGSTMDPERPARQGQWLADAVAYAATHPRLRALVWYSSDGHECDWRLDSSPVTRTSLAHLGTTARIEERG